MILLTQCLDALLAIGLAPLYLGWVNQCRSVLQNRSAPPLWQPYRQLRKLFAKVPVVAEHASPLFRMAPYLIFACLALVAACIPLLSTRLLLAPVADAIALVGLLAIARMMSALAAMDTGTAFGTLGARREMLLGFLSEPALLTVLFTASMLASSTSLATIVDTLLVRPFALYPSLAFAAVAYALVTLAENGRIPVDNPTTHLELTMIHEAMVLEYSGRHLALMEWAQALRLLVYSGMGLALFLPWGIATGSGAAGWPLAFLSLIVKLLLVGCAIAVIETLSAKLRIFRVPEFLGMAFIFGVLGMLIHILLGS